MAYLNEDGLARYDGLIKSWVTLKSGTVDGIDPLLNWQKTSTAGAVTCYPLPAAPIDPVVNFLFTETGPASGTKAPDNPSTITGVTQAKVTRCGKNLIRYPYYYETRTINDVTFTVNSDGSITASGTASARCVFWVNNTPSIPLAVGEEYVVSGCPSGGGWNSYSVQVEIRKDGSYVGSAQHFGTSESRNLIAASTDNRTGHVFIEIASGVTVSNLVFYPQLELGSVITSFEKYDGTDYIIPLNGTFYGGSVDLSAGTMTVTHRYIELDPDVISISCNISYEGENTSACYFYPSPQRAVPRACAWSNRFIRNDTLNNLLTDAEMIYTGSGASSILLRINKTRLGASYDATDRTAIETAWKTWLRANPTYVAYQLATPYTIQLTPQQIYSLSQLDAYTPRVNTVYSDQQSVEVGYPKSPQATSTELTNAIVSLGGEI